MLSRLRTTCPHCKVKFSEEDRAQHRRIHPACIPAYADAQEAKAKRKAEKQARMAAKVERAIDRQKREKQKTNGERKAGAQSALNRWVVHGRDKDQPCISCGKFHAGVNQGGHYRSRGSAPHLALDPRNVHRQCAPCNVYLHGNLINFRLGLVNRYGLAYVEALEADQEPRHYSGADYDAIKATYVQLLNKDLKRENAC
jgi:hypothetical protein